MSRFFRATLCLDSRPAGRDESVFAPVARAFVMFRPITITTGEYGATSPGSGVPGREDAGAFRRVFLQMRGKWRLIGRVSGEAVSDSGMGFFETYLPSE